MAAPRRLDAKQASSWDRDIVPRYLSLFGEAALDMFVVAQAGDIAHLGCRTGYPDTAFADRLAQGTLTGLDPSPAALELARAKASPRAGRKLDYRTSEKLPTSLPSASFTHALTLHPEPHAAKRRALLGEMARILLPNGQALVALPMRGSFQEILDLIREHAVRVVAPDLERAIDEAILARPTVESLEGELESAGFQHIDIDLWPTLLDFQSGDELFDSALMKLVVIPELRSLLKRDELDDALAHARRAIGRYWPEGGFELTVNVGCASGRVR